MVSGETAPTYTIVTFETATFTVVYAFNNFTNKTENIAKLENQIFDQIQIKQAVRAENEAAWNELDNLDSMALDDSLAVAVHSLKLNAMNGRSIPFPAQVNVYSTVECADAIVYRLSNLLGISVQAARKELGKLTGSQSIIKLQAGVMKLHCEDIDFECPVNLLKCNVTSYTPTKDDVHKYIVVQAWNRVLVSDQPTVDFPVYVSGINRDFNVTLDYDSNRGKLIAPELKNATYTFYCNNTVLSVQKLNVFDTAELRGKSGLFKVMVSAPGIDQVSEP